jgi:hypothetical protein
MDIDGSLQILPGENDKKPVHPVDASFLLDKEPHRHDMPEFKYKSTPNRFGKIH